MRLARIVFTLAGVWGLVAMTPPSVLIDTTGREQVSARPDGWHIAGGRS